MPGAELVGPLTRVPFAGDRGAAFDLPKHTLDPRYTACAAHRTACDCREAAVSEERTELRGELDAIYAAAARTLAGHPTFDLTAPTLAMFAAESDRVCPCTGCTIARAVYRDHCIPLRSPSDQRREIQEALT